MLMMVVRWQTENGANCSMFGSAFKASLSEGTNMPQLSFSAPFLCFFLWTNKERKVKYLGKQKMNTATSKCIIFVSNK